MQQYSPFFQTLHDETKPTGHLGRGTHCSVLRAVVFHDPLGKPLKEGQFADFAVIWDQDHDTRAIEAIEKIYRRGLLSSFVIFGERKGSFTAVRSEKDTSATRNLSFDPALLQRVDQLALSTRSLNCFSSANIHFIGDLVQRTEAELVRLPNFGGGSLRETKDQLAQINFRLGEDVKGWPPANIDELAKEQSRLWELEEEVSAICLSLQDPWSSAVVPLESGGSIIDDDEEKVRLYLGNLRMLWRLGIVALPKQKKIEVVGGDSGRAVGPSRQAVDVDGNEPGGTADHSEAHPAEQPLH